MNTADSIRMVKVVDATVVMSASPKDHHHDQGGNEHSSKYDQNPRSSIDSTRSTRKVVWPIKIVHFFRSVQRRIKKKNFNEESCDSRCCSPPSSRRSSGGKFDRSPSCHSLTGTEMEKESSSQENNNWNCRIRKYSASEITTHAVRRKLTSSSIPQEPQGPSTEYIVSVKTSDRFGAGTDAKVFLQMFGDQSSSDVLPLAHSNNVNKFERNYLDRFVFRDIVSLGRLQSIKIWHDNTGVGAAWHLAYVEVSDTSLGLLFRFPCHAWLAEDGDSQGVCREIRCFEVLQGPKRAIQPAFGVSKSTLSDSMPSLSTKNNRSGSLPVTPIITRKTKAAPPKKLTLPALDKAREVTVESVFTPAPTRPAPVVRLPLAVDEEIDPYSVHSLSNTTSAAKAFESRLVDTKRTVYDHSLLVSNGHLVDSVRRPSATSLSSDEEEEVAARALFNKDHVS